MDVESLQRTGRRGTSCLNVLLVVSVITLYVAVAALAAVGMMMMMELQSKHEAPQHQEQIAPQQQPDVPVYKMGNFASVEVKTTLGLKNSKNIPLAKIDYGNGTSVPERNYEFNAEQSYLQPLKEGSYFIFLDLNFKCTLIPCDSLLLSVYVGNTEGNKLTCEVKLEANETSVSKRCWTVTQIHKDRLFIGMTLSEELEKQTWTLKDATLGMFLVD